jgi:hypothetical protein
MSKMPISPLRRRMIEDMRSGGSPRRRRPTTSATSGRSRRADAHVADHGKWCGGSGRGERRPADSSLMAAQAAAACEGPGRWAGFLRNPDRSGEVCEKLRIRTKDALGTPV